MACLRCGICSINYPAAFAYTFCKACGTDLYTLQNTPHDDNWKERMEKAKTDVFNGEEGEDEMISLRQLPPIQSIHLTTHKNHVWVHDRVLNEAGYRDYGVDTVLRVVGVTEVDIYFEICGSAGHSTVNGRPRPGWWIQRIESPEEMFKDVPVREDGA